MKKLFYYSIPLILCWLGVFFSLMNFNETVLIAPILMASLTLLIFKVNEIVTEKQDEFYISLNDVVHRLIKNQQKEIDNIKNDVSDLLKTLKELEECKTKEAEIYERKFESLQKQIEILEKMVITITHLEK